MKCKTIIRAVTIAGLLIMMAAPMVAGTPVRLSFRDTTIASGSALSYPIYVDSSLSGYSIKSYQIRFTYNRTYFTFVGATAVGTIDSAWGSPTVFEVTPGTINIASAGSDTLAGTGKLVILNFTSNLFTSIYNYNEYGYFTFQAGANTILNQGFPTVDFRTGIVTLAPGPSISISPSTLLLTKGDNANFVVSGGHSPYRWSTTAPSVGLIDSVSGILTAVNAGFTKVAVRDSSGYVDTSGLVEVRAFKLSTRDTSCFQAQTISVPVNCTNLNGIGVVAGQLSLAFDQNRWTVVGIDTASSIVSNANLSFNVNGGTLSISFAGTSPLAGSGTLLSVRFKASSVNSGYTTFTIQNALFNQTLVGNVGSSNLINQALAPVTVTPSYAQTLVHGDSLQFQASGGVPPYAWSVSGSGRATISSSGWLKAIRSGMDTVRATDSLGSVGVSGAVSLYDFRLSVPDTSLISNSFVEVPLFVTTNDTGFVSFQMTLTYSTSTYVHLDSIITAGTLSAGMVSPQPSPHNGIATIAVSGTSKIFNGGMLCKLRFGVPDSTPRPSTTYLSLTNVLFNEGYPLAMVKNGSFQIVNGAVFSINPGTAALHSIVGQKDSAKFIVHNSGIANLTSSISVIGSSTFTVSTSNMNVPPADSATITVYFRPVSAGPANATIRFNTNDAYHLHVDIPVTGVAPYPIVAFSAASINFGTVRVGQHKDTTITISNTGTDTLKISNIVGSLPAFSARPTSANIPPGQSVIDTLRFTPAGGGGISGRFSVLSNSLTSPDTVGALGVGSTLYPILTFSSSTVAFGGVHVGSFKDTAITITNNGTDTLKISGITTSNSVFAARPTTQIVLPGQFFSDTLRFTPALTGGYSGRIFVASNAPSTPDTITVSGTGTPATDVSGPSMVPSDYSLEQNFPNPFNPSTNIRYGLRSRSTVRLVIYNILGQQVDELVNGEQNEGFHAVTWYPSGPSGAYFYKIDANSIDDPSDHFTQIRKMILMK